MISISIGDLNKRVNITEPRTAINAYGENVPTYSTIATVWASIEPKTGTGIALAAASANAAIATVTITIRYRPGIAVGVHRITYGRETYSITTIKDPDELKRFLILDCTEVTA